MRTPSLPSLQAVVKDNTEARAEVARLCQVFNIAWDNPVMIMDQETSKRFLTGDSDKQYDSFMKSTGLTEVSALYRALPCSACMHGY